MKRFALFVLLFIPFLLLGTNLKPEVTEEKLYLGQEFTVKVDVFAKENMSANFVTETKEAAILKIESGEEGKSVLIKMITLASGEVEIPQIALSLDGVLFNVEPFKVLSLERTSAEDMNLRDIKETVKIMEKDYTLLYLLLTFIALILLAFLFFKVKKKFSKKGEELSVKIEPSEVAAKFIKEAKEKREVGDYELFVDLSTIGLKTYLSVVSDCNYTEMTTYEVKRKLKKDSFFSPFYEQVLSILNLGDRFKFADDVLSENDFDEIIEGFIEIVKKSEIERVKKNDAT
ncbi:MAG: hypothetical protein ACOX2F_01655 [bacterium]